MGKQKTFEYTDELKAAQRALMAVRAERRAFLETLPAWGGDLTAVRQGLTEKQLAEYARLAEAERQAVHAVWADGYRATMSGEDRVIARSRLHHLDDPVEEQPAA